jgi:EAL domain-containing protein (putative c-di-GMP-specific phosphodiesterase class I)/GGDEF domain-containing protein
MRPSTERGAPRRRWARGRSGTPTTVTSARLPETAGVRSRVFPKIRSWFALGAPFELLSPLSVLRIVYGFAIALWLVEELVLRWPSSGVPWLLGATAIAAAVWCALGVVKTVRPLWCHVLAILGYGLVAVLAYSGQGRTGLVLASTLFLVPIATFVALFLGVRAVIGLQLVSALGLALALLGTLHLGSAILVAVVVSLAVLPASLTIRVLVSSLGRVGSIDPDTGLPNGAGLARQLAPGRSGVVAENRSAFVMATVLLAGVDDARQALGYKVGTELLRRAVEDLGQVLPAEASVTRVEADELVVTYDLDCALAPSDRANQSGQVPEAVLATGQALARDLTRTIGSGRYLVGRVEVLLRAHVGVVFAPWDGNEVAELVRRSSLSARHAAASGQSVAVWDGDRASLTPEDLALLADLRLAVERDELWLAYQPQVSAATDRTESVEALLRWHSAVHGNVPPGRFIVLAEKTGLIDRLTEWVLVEALDAQVRWRRAGLELPVSVNFSAKTLSRPDLSGWILSELDVRKLPPSSLTVEVTETAAADLLQADYVLRPLHERGVRISIDDFGTGYTSLAAIPYLPLDEIKVDLSFVRRALSSPADDAIVRCVRELAHRLGIATVAEGVEDEAIRHLMTGIGFDRLQGYHLSKPLGEQALLQFIRATSSVASSVVEFDGQVEELVSRDPGRRARALRSVTRRPVPTRSRN